MKNLKIRIKITIASVLLIVVFGSLLTVIDLTSDYKIGVYDYKKAGLEIARNSEYELAHFLYINDFVELQRAINTLVKNNSDILYAFILNSNNRIIVHSFDNGFPADLLKTNMESIENVELLDIGKNSVYDISYPINRGKLGTIRLGISRARLIKELKSELLTQILLLIGFIILGAIVSYFVSNLLSRPVKKLVYLVNDVSKGNFEQSVEINSKDEIGQLSKSFNDMCVNLKFLTDKLEKKINELNEKNMEYESLNEEYIAQNEELQHNIEEIKVINTKLIEAKEKAEECDKLKTAFLANISHEIRTPMNGILGFANLLKSSGLKSAKQEDYVDVIQKSGKRMLNIINDLIDISKIEAGQSQLNYEQFSLNGVIEELHTFFSQQAEVKGIKLHSKRGLKNKDDIILADKIKITQVLSNLLNNSIKYTESGKIIFGYEIIEDNLKFFVKDTGKGIPPDMLEKIFERFRQVDCSLSSGYEGAGLGLSISKAFVEMHGGLIWVESNPEKGSTFYFTIPYKSELYIEEEIPEIIQTIESISLPKGITLLVVEDDYTSILLLEEYLSHMNFKILRANNGEEALEIVKQNPSIDLILMDIKMPVMNGFEATKQIKKIYPNLPVIAITAYAQTQDRTNAIEAGSDDFVSKPLDVEILINKINKYITVE